MGYLITKFYQTLSRNFGEQTRKQLTVRQDLPSIHPILFTPAGSESYTGTEARSLLHEEAGNRLTEKL